MLDLVAQTFILNIHELLHEQLNMSNIKNIFWARLDS